MYFDGDDNPRDVIARGLPDSTLTAWLKYNAANPNDTVARNTLYPDFYEHFTFKKEPRVGRYWKPRENGFGGTIGRIYAVSPRDTEKYYLRTLLYKIPGAKRFADLRMHDGQLYPSYQSTARAMGLLVDDSEWSRTLTEASLSQSPRNLRQLFAILIVFCDLSDPFQLWLDHQSKLAEDYLYNARVLAQEQQQTPIPSEISDVCSLSSGFERDLG